MLVVAADAVRAVGDAERLGVHATVRRVDWPAIRDRVFGRIDPLHERAIECRRRSGVDVFTAPARFVGPKVLDVDGERLTAEHIVVSAGSRPVVPPIPGLDRVPFHASDTIMRVDAIPRSLLAIGGGFIAAEMGHVFDAFGSTVTLVERGPQLLKTDDEDVSARFTELAAWRFRLRLNSTVVSVEPRRRGVAAIVAGPDGEETVAADAVLVATGRRPNTDLLDVAAGGLEVDEHGHLVTDGAHRTATADVFAMGDAANHFQLKHMANAEMRVVRHNLLHPDDFCQTPIGLVPHAVFSEPQVASVAPNRAGSTPAQDRLRRSPGIDAAAAVAAGDDARPDGRPARPRRPVRASGADRGSGTGAARALTARAVRRVVATGTRRRRRRVTQVAAGTSPPRDGRHTRTTQSLITLLHQPGCDSCQAS